MNKRKRSVIFFVLSLMLISPGCAKAKRVVSSGSSGNRQKPPQKLRSYNGLRFSPTHDPFQVVLIESTKTTVAVTFNIPVNPLSLNQKNILINGEPLTRANKIRFNKTGNLIEINTDLSVGTRFTIEFTDLESYDGEKLTVTKFNSLLPWTSTEYPSIKTEENEE